MKILQVLFSGLGGHGSVAFSLVRADCSRAHAHAMLFYGVESLAPGYSESCAELGVEQAVVLKKPGLDLDSWRQVIAGIKRLSPDVILLHSTSLVGALAAYTRFRPTSMVVVDHLANQVKQPRDWVFLAMSLALADRTVFLSESFGREVRQRLGRLYVPDRVEIIPNGIDVAAFAPTPAAPPVPRSEFRVGMHSRFSPSKDHATLLRALARLRESRSEAGALPVRLVLAGGGETLSAAVELTRRLELDDRVEFLGTLPERELPAYLHSLDLYVQSSGGETMSTAVMQAMAAGLPVIASDVPGLHEMLRAGQLGVLFPRGDEVALAAEIDRLRQQPDERARLARVGQAHAREQWSQDTMFRGYDRMLSRLQARHGGRLSVPGRAAK